MNIFIVENSGTSRDRLQSILSDITGIRVIGHATADEPGVIERIDTLLPDVVIFDSLRDMAVVGMLESIKKCHPMIKVMVLDDCANELHFNRCKRAGVDHFFDRSSQIMRTRAALWKCVYDYRFGSHLDALFP
ncbi:MAG: hypothetical protein Q7S46_08055 [Gallionella sp.]|nr:hypothetical protein [Gallionella sp.]